MRNAASVRSARRTFRSSATLRRSADVMSAFRVEQTDPAFFYGTLADDAVAQIESFIPLADAFVVDVGGGPGYFRSAFAKVGASYLAVDYDRSELIAADLLQAQTILGSGTDLPLRTGSVDVCFSSNVLEHVPTPERMADEMVRATRPGGIAYISYTLWLGPWGGHETAPWHLFGGAYAARRYERKHGRPPKNVFGTSLYALTAARMLAWADAVERDGRAEVLAAFPRYLPWWTYWITLVPGLREFVMWNLVLVLRRR